MRRPPTPSRRALAGGAAALVAALLAAGCDTSPVAASVNGAEIKQTALNQEVRLETANRAYVDAVDRVAAANGSTYSVVGDAPGALSSRFVDGVLTTLIDARAVHQHLAATRQGPSPEAYAAARAVDEALFGRLWLSFPAGFRDQQVAQDAEHAAIEPPPPAVELAQLRRPYQGTQQYFFAQVCVRTVAVTVDGPDGTLDRQASYARAATIADDYNTAADAGPGAAVTTPPQAGQVACYSGAALEAQGPELFTRVLALAPGHAAPPVPTGYGDSVTEVASRTTLPLDPTVARALALGITEAQGGADPALQQVVAAAHVTVDPQYGSWDPRSLQVVASSPLGASSQAGGAAGGGSGTGG